MYELSPKDKVDSLKNDPEFKVALERWNALNAQVEANLAEMKTCVAEMHRVGKVHQMAIWQAFNSIEEYQLAIGQKKR